MKQEGIRLITNLIHTQEGVFRVNIDYSALDLTAEEAEPLQSVLKGRYGTGALAYIKSSIQIEGDFIIGLDFKNEHAAQKLVQEIQREAAKLRQGTSLLTPIQGEIIWVCPMLSFALSKQATS